MKKFLSSSLQNFLKETDKKILANFETELKKSRSEFCSKINEEIKEIKNKFDKLEENYKVINDERKSLKKDAR